MMAAFWPNAGKFFVSAVVVLGLFSRHETASASTAGGEVVHETVTLSDLLTSQGFEATEIASHDLLDDPGNAVITHALVGGYRATTVSVSGTLRGDNAEGNWFRDARIQISPADGLPFLVMTSEATSVNFVGETDVFENVISETLPEQTSGFGQPIMAGPAVFEFYELNDEAPNANDNSFLDLTIDFIENLVENETFSLGTLNSGVAYSNDTHSHVPGGLDLFEFSLPQSGVVDLVTSESENGVFGFDITDTEIGLFDGSGALIAQSDDFQGDGYAQLVNLSLAAGDYTLVTATFDSSLNSELALGDDIGLVTGGMWDGDYALDVTFTPDNGGGTLACDFDTDTDCDLSDLDALYENFGTAAATFDLNGDGAVDGADILSWLSDASDASNTANTGGDTYRLGDLNLDGTVNSTDLGFLLNNFGDLSGLNYGEGNLNDDAVVNSTDLGFVLNNFGLASASAVAVPEPNPTAMWWGAVVMLLIGCRRRR